MKTSTEDSNIKKILIKNDKHENTSRYEDVIVDSYESYFKNPNFSKIPISILKNILKKITFSEKSSILDLNSLFNGQQSKYIEQIKINEDSFSFKEIIEILFSFTDIPIFEALKLKYHEEQSYPERDWKYELKQSQIQIYKLKQKIEDLQREKIKFNPALQNIQKPEKLTRSLNNACWEGDYNSALYWIQQNKDAVNVRDHFGWLPLAEAIWANRNDIFKLVLANGPPIDDQITKVPLNSNIN